MNQDMLINQEGSNLCELGIDVYDIYSPNLDKAEIIVTAKLGKLFLLFDPITLNSVIKFFRNTRSSKT